MKWLTIFSLFLGMNLYSQPYIIQWQKTYGGSDRDKAASIIRTSDGGYIICGTTFSSDGDVSSLKGVSDVWLIGIDSLGNIVWDKCFGSAYGSEQGYSILPDSLNGFTIGGIANGDDGDVSGVHGISLPGSPGYDDIWIFRIDSLHNVIWQHCLGGSYDDWIRSIARTKIGDYLIGGYTYSRDGDVLCSSADVGWSFTYNPDSGIIWQYCNTGGYSKIVSAIQLRDSGYVVIGYREFVIPSFCSIGNYDVSLAKMHPSGQMYWDRCLGGSMEDVGLDVIENTDGTLWFVGSTNSNDVQVSVNYGSDDGWLVKTDSMGQLLLQSSIGGAGTDGIEKLFKTSDGGLLMIGTTSSSTINGLQIGYHGYTDYLLIKTDSSGNITWVQCYGGTQEDRAYNAIENPDGSYMVIGTSTSSDGDVSLNRGQYDIWLMKLVPDPSVSIEKNNPFTDLTASFDVSTGNAFVRYFSLNSNDAIISLFDLTGRLIYSIGHQSIAGLNKVQLNGIDFTSGMYLLRLTSGSSQRQVKTVYIK